MKHGKQHIFLFIYLLFTIPLLILSYKVSKDKSLDVFHYDIQIYYSYLPATFIEKDPLFERTAEYDSISKYWVEKTPIGRNVPKTSMGVAMLETPFFGLGHLYAKMQTNVVANGFTKPYQIAISFSSTIYAILGAWFLFLFLARRFNRGVSFISVMLLLYGTNLFFYSVFEIGMSHPYTFFLLSALLLSLDNWFIKKNIWTSLTIGVLLGFIVLVRPINILFILPLLMLFKPNDTNWILYLKSIIQPFKYLLFLVLGGLIVWLPQFLFWKIQANSLLYFSYTGERFFWSKPHVIDGLFSFRKGWFIYTPMMFFALLGLYRLFFTKRMYFWTLSIFLPLFLYVTFSWWCWWYGGGFSARTLVDILPFMAIPLASLLEWIVSHTKRVYLLIFPLFFIYLNVFQSWQYYMHFLHYDSMTWASYKSIFLKRYTPEGYWEKLKEPDYDKARETGM